MTSRQHAADSGALAAAEALRARVGDIPIDVNADAVAASSIDTYWKAKALAAAGRPYLAEAVVRPRTAEEVARVLAAATEAGVIVTPRAGGSGSQGGAVPDRGGVVLDTSALDQILELDEVSQTVRVQAGVQGLALEEWLNARGYTFPHFPASVHLARVGGYLSAKGSGVLSTKYGKIEDLVASMEVALPTGELIRTLAVPRHSVGPDLNQVFIGSEGTMGVITEATLIIKALPEKHAFRLYSFPDIPSALTAVRRSIQSGWRPCMVRVYDPDATEANLRRVLDLDITGVQVIMGYDGPGALVDLESAAVEAEFVACGATVGDHAIADAWWENRYKIYYPPYRPELPSIWGTADIVATHDKILPAYEALRVFFRTAFPDNDVWFGGHFSHWYAWGAMVYGRFTVRRPPADLDDSIKLYDEIWRRSSEIVLAHGALLNDHHGVGLKLADDVARQWGPAWQVVERIKDVLDPARISNPGKLGL
ncbi:MAG: FAD-binding oxidoreductase [Gaiellales bacterium]